MAQRRCRAQLQYPLIVYLRTELLVGLLRLHGGPVVPVIAVCTCIFLCVQTRAHSTYTATLPRAPFSLSLSLSLSVSLCFSLFLSVSLCALFALFSFSYFFFRSSDHQSDSVHLDSFKLTVAVLFEASAIGCWVSPLARCTESLPPEIHLPPQVHRWRPRTYSRSIINMNQEAVDRPRIVQPLMTTAWLTGRH